MVQQQRIDTSASHGAPHASGERSGFDPDVIKLAERILDQVREEFVLWIEEGVGKLAAARVAFAAQQNAASLGELRRVAHDLKGLGKTFGFPLAGRVAASLCKLCDGMVAGASLPLTLVDAHVDALKIILRGSAKNLPDSRTANVLVTELETRVEAHLNP